LTPETLEITSPEVRAYEFATPVEEWKRARAELAGRADWIVPVGHISVDEARELARSDPRLALIVSGHSHTYLKQGEREGEALIVQSGSKASALGRVDVWLDPLTFRVLRSEAQLIDLLEVEAQNVRELPQVSAVTQACAALAARAAEALKTVVGELGTPLSRVVHDGCSAPGSWIADALRARMQADIGVHNRGGTRCDLPAGKITRRDLFELLPFDNWSVSVELSGEQIEAFVRRSLESGKHTGMDFSGLRLIVQRRPDGSRRLLRIEVTGVPLDKAKSYSVATNSFLAQGGDGAQEFAAAAARREDPILLRDLMELQFAATPRITLPMDATLRYAEESP
jgi:5'-nucleotidase